MLISTSFEIGASISINYGVLMLELFISSASIIVIRLSKSDANDFIACLSLLLYLLVV